ncbi:MAG: DUF3795 domain-containing protein [Bacillota bacterium]|jgi:hypothetical protein
MIMAACGLDCAACSVYIATVQSDDQLRKQTAAHAPHAKARLDKLNSQKQG